MSIPSQFTGLAVHSAPQTKDSMELKPHTYTPREFTPKDVVIKVICCGLCGSDVSGITASNTLTPGIFGHEIVGTVVKAGPESGHKEGDRVGVGGEQSSCHECWNCQHSHENMCAKKTFTIQTPMPSKVQPFAQGGFADYFMCEGAFAIPIPDRLSSVQAAPMLCGGSTVYGPMKYAGVGPGSNVGVIGLGGLGHMAVGFAVALGAEAYVFSTSASKKEDALALGAKDLLVTKDQAEVKEKYSGFFDLIISTSGAANQPFVELYLPLLRFRGELVLVGLTPDKLQIGLYNVVGKKVTAWAIGSPSDMKEMLQVAADKNVKAWIEERPMKDLGKTVVDQLNGKARYRYVMVN